MESIPGYDRWKTTEPEEPLRCDYCENEIPRGGKFYRYRDSIICEDCMEDFADYND